MDITDLSTNKEDWNMSTKNWVIETSVENIKVLSLYARLVGWKYDSWLAGDDREKDIYPESESGKLTMYLNSDFDFPTDEGECLVEEAVGIGCFIVVDEPLKDIMTYLEGKANGKEYTERDLKVFSYFREKHKFYIFEDKEGLEVSKNAILSTVPEKQRVV